MIGATPIPIGDDLYTTPGTPTKMLVIAEPGHIKLIQDRFHGQLGDSLCIVESKPNYLEINDPIVNKGTALKFIANQLNINQEEIMAFGNGINDIEMLRYSGWGVAVDNSPAAVKNIARLVTGTNDEDGVAEVIENYILS
jgi:Cof subfamily protein (haloacid dehalogenase superfamily)